MTDSSQHTVMGVDPTFNFGDFGDFNVMPIAFRYLLLEHRKEGHAPVFRSNTCSPAESFLLITTLFQPW